MYFFELTIKQTILLHICMYMYVVYMEFLHIDFSADIFLNNQWVVSKPTLNISHPTLNTNYRLDTEANCIDRDWIAYHA